MNYSSEQTNQEIFNDVFGSAKDVYNRGPESDVFLTPHGEVKIKRATECTSEEKNSTKPYPGEVRINRKKYYLLYA